MSTYFARTILSFLSLTVLVFMGGGLDLRQANAAQYNAIDGYVSDLRQGLDFLRLDTPGLDQFTWNELNQNGFDYLGSNWRLASREELLGFWNTLDPLANYTSLVFNDARDFDALQLALDVIGRTSGSGAQASAFGLTSYTFTDDFDTIALAGYVFSNNSNMEFFPPGDFAINQPIGLDTRGIPGWMVRETVISAVPLPAAFPLFASVLVGIGGAGLWKRRKRSDVNSALG